MPRARPVSSVKVSAPVKRGSSSILLILPVSLLPIGDPLYRLRDALRAGFVRLRVDDPLHILALRTWREALEVCERGLVLLQRRGELLRRRKGGLRLDGAFGFLDTSLVQGHRFLDVAEELFLRR